MPSRPVHRLIRQGRSQPLTTKQLPGAGTHFLATDLGDAFFSDEGGPTYLREATKGLVTALIKVIVITTIMDNRS